MVDSGRQRIQRTVVPRQQINQRIIQDIGLKKPLKVLEAGLTIRAKAERQAKAKADRLRLRAFQNEADGIINPATAQVAASRGLNVFTTYNEQKSLIGTQIDKAVEELPEDLREQGRLTATGRMQGFEKVSVAHHLKESRTLVDSTYKTNSQNLTRHMALNARDDDAFLGGLQEMRALNTEFAEIAGLDAQTAKLQNEKSVSFAVLKSLESMESLGDSQAALDFFEKHEQRMTLDDKKKAQTALSRIRTADRTTQAKSLSEEARSLFQNDMIAAHQFMAGRTAKDGDLYRESIQFYDHESTFRTREQKRIVDENTGRGYDILTANGGFVTDDVRALIPAKNLAQAQQYAANLRNGKFTETNFKRYGELNDMAFERPEDFAQVNIDAEAPNLSLKHRGELKSRQDEVRNRTRSQKDKIQFASSQRASALIDSVIASRGVDKAIVPDQYHTLFSIGRDVYDEVIVANPNETNPRVIEREFEKAFRAQNIPTIKNPERGFLSDVGEFFGAPVERDALFGVEPEFNFLTIQEARRRAEEGLDLLPIDEADPRLVERLRVQYERLKGRQPTTPQMQKFLNNAVSKILKVQ